MHYPWQQNPFHDL